MVFGRIWKPWTVEVVGEHTGLVSQLSWYRFWTEEKAQEVADMLNAMKSTQHLATTSFRTAKINR